MGPQARKVDPFGVWDLPPSYSGDISTNLTSSANANTDSNFSLLPPSLSGQTLQSALDNLSKGSFSDLQYNGSGGAPGSALDPGSIGGQTPGFGLSPSITPSKVCLFVCKRQCIPNCDFFRWTSATGALEAQAAARQEALEKELREHLHIRILSGLAARMLCVETFR